MPSDVRGRYKTWSIRISDFLDKKECTSVKMKHRNKNATSGTVTSLQKSFEIYIILANIVHLCDV